MNTQTATQQTVHIEQTRKNILVTAHKDIASFGIKAGETFLLRRVAKYTYTVKRITVLSRIVHADGSITCQFRNGEGREYSATLRRNGQHSCSCDSTTECYHLVILKATENARAAACKAAPVITAPTVEKYLPLNGNKPFSLLRVA